MKTKLELHNVSVHNWTKTSPGSLYNYVIELIYYVIASQGFDVYIQLSPRFLSPLITGHTTLTKAELML